MTKKALYLAGGGARGAYQAGVLKAMYDILKTPSLPFEVISGVSVGSINACILAEQAHDFRVATEKLEMLWRDISSNYIFDATNLGLSKSLFSNVTRAVSKRNQAGHLLDSRPLQAFINQHIQFESIQAHIESGLLDSFEIISHCYETQQTISFYQHHLPVFEDWQYPRHVSQRTHLSMEHILASSALPLFFPTVKINGLHYGDGSMGLVSPLRGVIRFQAEQVMIIGTRPLSNFVHDHLAYKTDIGFANILGGMLSALFLDNLDRDIEMVNRMNDIARLLSLWKKRYSPWRPIKTMYLRPSMDVASMAQAQYKSMPTLLRFMLNLLGAKSQSGDLLSFLLFEPGFTKALLELGYRDGMDNADEIVEFFS